MKRKGLAILLSMMLILSIMSPINALADTYIQLSIYDGSVTITEDGNYHIIGDGTETSNSVVVAKDVNANIRLENVNIHSNRPFSIENDSKGNVNIELIGNNSLISSDGPGICKNGAGEDVGTLTIDGMGSLLAKNIGVDGAGIGSDNQKDTKNIVINGGTITAVAGNYGAGIGGGGGGGCGSNITISGGTVVATGGEYQGAGIGGGSDYHNEKGDGSNITISGGRVTATALSTGAGIGGGHGAGSDIIISGGTVVAKGAVGAADIGGSKPSTTGTLVQTVEVFQDENTPATNNFSNAIVYSDKQYTVKGTVDLNDDLEIKSGESLKIEEGASLEVNNLINNGTIDNGGTVIGVVDNHGEIKGKAIILIEGIDNNGTYCGSKEITVKGDDIEKVTLTVASNVTDIQLVGGKYSIAPNSQVQKITVKDINGNTVSKNVTIKEHVKSDWIIDKAATFDAAGSKHIECTACHSVLETKTIDKLVAFSVLEGANSTVNKDDGALSIRIDHAFTEDVIVEVDGNLVDRSNYKVTEGSTIITFTDTYIKTLAAGTHNVKVTFDDGTATTSFVVKETTTPKTGDTSGLAGWAMLAVLAAGTAVFAKRRRED